MSLSQFHKDFCKYFSYEKGRTSRTIDTYSYNFNEFLRYLESLGKPLDLSALETHEYLRSFMYSLLDRRLHKKTVRQRMLGLKSFCKYLVREGSLIQNPFDRFDIPRKEKSLPRPLAQKVKDRLLQGLKKRFNKTGNLRDLQAVVIVELGFKVGMRKGAMRNLKWENIDFKRGYVYVIDKGQKEKCYPLVPSVIHWLKHLKLCQGASSGSVLLSPRSGTPISMTSLHDEFKRYVRLVGLNEKEVSLHRMRHSFGTFLHERGLELPEIQEIMGHEGLESARGYVEVNKKILKEKLRRAFSNEK